MLELATDLELVRAPHWSWLAVGYFFLGGLAGGSAMLATAADVFGRGEHRRAARLGFLVALPAILLGAALLVVDLKQPGRFWHMLLQSERPPTPMWKGWSPMSVGAWALAAFGALAAASFVGTLALDGRLPRRFAFLRDGPVGRVLSVLGAGVGFFIASYTGVLISVTNRPLWSETALLGLVFVLSAASTSCALLLLLLRREQPVETASTEWLSWLGARVALLELVALVVLVATLGAASKPWWGAYGVLLAVGVVGLGMVVPWLLDRRARAERTPSSAWAPALVLVGGLLLRAVVVLSVDGL